MQNGNSSSPLQVRATPVICRTPRSIPQAKISDQQQRPLRIGAHSDIARNEGVALLKDRRQIGMPEFRVGSQVAPAMLLAELYDSCAGAFRGCLPLEFQIGKEAYLDRRKTLSLMPPPPRIWADRKFLRFCLSYLDKSADWSNEDYTIRLAVADNQLRIEGKLETVFCPVRGEWLGVSTVFAKILFRRLPKRFSNSVVVLQQEGKALRIDRHLIPASWEEKS